MELAGSIVTGLVGVIHIYIVVLESFWWSRMVKVFGVPRDQRDNQLLKTTVQNQGAYNAVLVAGLFWALAHPDPAIAFQLKLFFLGAVAAMGTVGAVTANVRILFVQTIPAGLGLGLVLAAGTGSL